MIKQIIGHEHYINEKASSICIGTFDGFHLGHQALVKHSEFMLTFNPHPKSILYPKMPIERLTFPDEQRYFFPNQLIIPFTKTVADMHAIEFLNKFIAPLNPHKITIGYDFKFGKNGHGNPTLLKNWGHQNNCSIITLDIQTHPNKTPYKSSIIRKTLKEDPNTALEYLGHPYLISGTVVQGKKRGKTIGFPTANLAVPPHKCLPKFGVYSSHAIIENKHYPAITNIGKNPTFNQTHPTIETHILNGFSDNIYNKNIMVLLHKFIRNEQPFQSEQDLKNQIKKDINTATITHQSLPLQASI